MPYQRLRFLFLNIGHFIDHMFMLIFAKAPSAPVSLSGWPKTALMPR